MTMDLRQKETLLIEALLSALDARESARAANASMLLYLSDILVQRAREELDIVKRSSETAAATPPGRPGPRPT